jgi:16S rRNA (uracil1498-N3)-methyltransferase
VRRLSRIYTSEDLAVGNIIELEGQAAHYLARVLRLSAGDPVTLFKGNGLDYLGEVLEMKRRQVLIRLSGSKNPATESQLKITLVQAITRGERMDYTVQKATELGVSIIQPVFSERVEVKLDEKRQAKRVEHWRGVVISACEQSGRAVIPQILEPLPLGDWLEGNCDGQRLVLDPNAGIKLGACELEGDTISVLVGPEGGFGLEELAQVTASGITAVSLGPRVLRTESAGPAAITVLQVMAGDF